jgi:glycosyltransferase involved in cell wall biosynthesis
MKVSVIIPVFNAELYVAQAVASALEQPETGEVVLVEDGSRDNSLKVCQDIFNRENRVSLFRHSEGRNMGAGASRNLGIQKAKYEWLAFLDADDYYLPERFKTARELINQRPDIDGVHEAIGMHYYSERAKNHWIQKEGGGLTGLKEAIASENLFNTLVNGGKGYIHLDGLVVRKTIILKSGLFPVKLRLHQDTAFIYQIAACGRLISGRQNEPVALRGIHDHNRILAPYDAVYTRFLLWQHMLIWSTRHGIARWQKNLIRRKWVVATIRYLKRKFLMRWQGA